MPVVWDTRSVRAPDDVVAEATVARSRRPADALWLTPIERWWRRRTQERRRHHHQADPWADLSAAFGTRRGGCAHGGGDLLRR